MGNFEVRLLSIAVLVGFIPAAAPAQPAGDEMVLVQSGQERFYMSRHEVTVEQMKAFDPDYHPAYTYFDDARMPATAITFTQAKAYCEAQGKRLPTSEEWVVACGGLEGTAYAYGNNYDPNQARVGRKNWTDGPKAVMNYEKNRAGLYDMSGNVWEWVDDGGGEGGMQKVYGGSWTDGPRLTRCGSARRAKVDLKSLNYGFRCVRSLTEVDRIRLARAAAEARRKVQARVRREAARRKAAVKAAEAARKAKIEAKAKTAREAELAEEQARAAEAARIAAAFARKVEGMLKIETSAFKTFYIDPHEVSVEAYRAFKPTYRPDEFSIGPRMPATGITHEQAREYCGSLGKRLPTSEEWVAACLGETGDIYSYGKRYDPTRARTGLAWSAGAGEVAGGAPNVYGAQDMVGNVWEWVDGWYGNNRELRAIFGGSWLDDEKRAKCTGADWARPDDRRSDVGFRCAVGAD